MTGRLTARTLTRVLGVQPLAATALAALARSRSGPADHAVRLTALLVATSPLAVVLPGRVRRRAVAGMLDRVFQEPAELMLFAGLIGDLRDAPCGGLLPE